MDKLEQLFGLQKKLQARMRPEARFGAPDLGVHDSDAGTEMTRRGVLALVAELVELLNELNWKWWRAPSAEKPNYARVHEEIVDVFHFAVNFALLWGLDPADLVARFAEKHAANISRQENGL